MKSFFTKLGTLLLCGVAVAMVGCTDFSEDIQAGDKVLGDKIEQLQSTTASTIAELQASIAALETAQKKMETDYAKLSDLNAAKTELQEALNSKVQTLNSTIAAINTTLDGKADKTTVAALQKSMEDAVAEANQIIQNLVAAQTALEAEIAKKADKTQLDGVAADVETLKGGYQETALALTNLQSALEGTQLDLAATESSLKQTQADVESLIEGYMQTVAALQQFQSDLAAKASQADLELAQKDIKALKEAAANAVYAITNLNTAVEALDARVEAVEEFMKSAKEEIQNHTNQLLELSFALEQAKGNLEDEAEIRAKADEALQQAYAALTAELTNFEMAYAVDKAELEAQIDLLKEEAKKNTEGITNLNGKFEAAIAELEAQLDKLEAKHAEDYASILNLIASNRTEMEQVILDLEEELRAAFEAADVEVTEYVDEQILYVLTTVANSFNQHELWLNSLQENVDTLQEDLINALNIIATNRTELEQVISDLEVKLDAKIDDVYAQSLNLIATNRTELEQIILDLENNLKGLIGDLQDRFDVMEGKVADLEEQTAELENAVVALQNAHSLLTEQLQNKLTNIDNTIEALQEADADNANAIKALQEAHSLLTEQLQNKLTNIDNTIETLTEAIANNKNAIAANGASIEANATLIAKNAQDIIKASTVVAEFKAEYQVFVQNVNLAITNLSTAAETFKSDIEGLVENVEDIFDTLDTVQEDLLSAIGRISALEDAVKALQDAHAAIIEGLQNKFTNVDSDIVALQDADAALRAELIKAVKELYDNDSSIAENLANHTHKLMGLINTLEEKLRGEISDLAKRVQSLVYVPEYSDGKANVHYGAVINLNADLTNLADVTFVPAKTTLRYKVNSTSATIVDEIVEAYKTNPAILSYDVVGVTVRGASESEPTLQVVGVSKDKDGYLLVDVLAKNFDKSFYLREIKKTVTSDSNNSNIFDKIWGLITGTGSSNNNITNLIVALAEKTTSNNGYSAALVLADEKTVNNVASEFTNLIADKNFDVLTLGARYNKGNQQIVLSSAKSIPSLKIPYANDKHRIPSSDTSLVINTTASEPVVELVKDNEKITCTPDQLYEKYGYKVDIKRGRHVVSYNSDHSLDPASSVKDWNDTVVSYNIDKFIVDGVDEIGTSRRVKLTAYDNENNIKYEQRVNSYIDVVDVYYLEGQSVAVADRVTIYKNIVYINFEFDETAGSKTHKTWTLDLANQLRGTDADKTPYAQDLVFANVEYDNIYDIAAMTVETSTLELNGEADATPVTIHPISGPSTNNGRGVATIKFAKGYKFAKNRENTYVFTQERKINDKTNAIITFTAVLGQLPAAVEVNSTVDLKLVPGETYFDGNDALIADAYAEFGAANAGFTATNVNDLMFAALTDSKNIVENAPAYSHENLNFNVVDNDDKTFVRLYKEQFEGVNVPETFSFKKTVNTWFDVPFVFNVTATPHLPEIALVRSTEYASATADPEVYSVDLHARVVGGKYTVVQSDLAYYFNVIGDVNNTQAVSFTVVDGAVSTIADNVVSVDPLPEGVYNPLIDETVTAYLKKSEAVLTWKDKSTQIKVKATLWAGAYPIDEAYVILNVKDPLTFKAPSISEERKIEENTVAYVYRDFALYSTAVDAYGNPAHEDFDKNLFNTKAGSIKNILAADIKDTYGIELDVKMQTIYEQTELGTVLYDASKYIWNEDDGILTLKKDDAAMLLNPIVAEFAVTFKHNVHGASAQCSETKTMTVTFYQN